MLVNLLGQWPTWRSCRQAQNDGFTEKQPWGNMSIAMCQGGHGLRWGVHSNWRHGHAVRRKAIDSIDSIDFAVCLQIIQGEQKHVRMSLCHVVFLVFRDESLQDWRTTSHRLAASPTSWTILSMPFATSSLCVLDV